MALFAICYYSFTIRFCKILTILYYVSIMILKKMEKVVSMGQRGAKSKYERLVKPYLTEINKKVREGVTEAAIADALGICVASLNNYRNKYPEFAEALSKDKGKDELQALINAGVEAAKGGYKENEQTIYKTVKITFERGSNL